MSYYRIKRNFKCILLQNFPSSCTLYCILIQIFFIGSVRMFDLRHLEHSTIIYEDPQHTPLLRLAWNKQDPNYLATVAMDACEVIILVKLKIVQ